MPVDLVFHSPNYCSFIHDDIINMSVMFICSMLVNRIQFELLKSFNFDVLSFSLANNSIAKAKSLTT